MQRALITGILGQDGAYLARLLLKKGFEVYGGDNSTGHRETWRLDCLGITKDVQMVPFNLLEYSNMAHQINRIKPTEIYNLGAQTFVGTSFTQPLLTLETNALGVSRLLEAIHGIPVKFYQASTSEMFGRSKAPQNERTAFLPQSPYGVAKLAAHHLVGLKRQTGLFGVCGILFNHESPLRGNNFVTKKVAREVAAIVNNRATVLKLGNLEAKRDWGFAGDYVEAMFTMMHHETPNDYVVATGETHTVRELVEAAFDFYELPIMWEGEGPGECGFVKGKKVVQIDPDLYRPCEVNVLQGDAMKMKQLGWKPKTSFAELVKMMVEHEEKSHVEIA
jgi:GDPmannose 4,6-dehydratase